MKNVKEKLQNVNVLNFTKHDDSQSSHNKTIKIIFQFIVLPAFHKFRQTDQTKKQINILARHKLTAQLAFN